MAQGFCITAFDMRLRHTAYLYVDGFEPPGIPAAMLDIHQLNAGMRAMIAQLLVKVSQIALTFHLFQPEKTHTLLNVS